MTEQLPKTDKPENAFNYLLREPRYARRLRQLNSTAGLLALLVIADVLYGCT